MNTSLAALLESLKNQAGPSAVCVAFCEYCEFPLTLLSYLILRKAVIDRRSQFGTADK